MPSSSPRPGVPNTSAIAEAKAAGSWWCNDVSRNAIGDLIKGLVLVNTSGHDRAAGGHRFQDDDWEVLVTDRWKDDDVGRGIERPGIGVVPQHPETVRDVKVLGQGFEFRALRAIARNDKNHVVERAR